MSVRVRTFAFSNVTSKGSSHQPWPAKLGDVTGCGTWPVPCTCFGCECCKYRPLICKVFRFPGPQSHPTCFTYIGVSFTRFSSGAVAFRPQALLSECVSQRLNLRARSELDVVPFIAQSIWGRSFQRDNGQIRSTTDGMVKQLLEQFSTIYALNKNCA